MTHASLQSSSTRVSARTLFLLLFAASIALGLGAACGDPEVPPPASLDGPRNLAHAKNCIVKTTSDAATPALRVAAERCEEGEFQDAFSTQIVHFGYVSNQYGNSLGVLNYNRANPDLVDTSVGIPGVSHIPVGREPSFVTASQDGNFIFVYNQLDQDLSVISLDLFEEIARIPIQEPVLGLITPTGRDSVLALGATSNALFEITWTFTCAEENVYTVGCKPSFEYAKTALLTFPEDVRVQTITPSPTDAKIFTTYAKQAHLGEVLLNDIEGASCLDPTASAPCIARRMGLTFGCLDGLDNDGDGLIDSADPQCTSPTAGETQGGATGVRGSLCNDGLDNDGDGLTDALDPGCSFSLDDSETGSVLPIPCADGLDNDGDGLIDRDDPTCQDPQTGFWNPSALSETDLPVCSDGIDNDGDGRTDLEDPSCTDPAHTSELVKPACSNLLDDDRDGLIDSEDPNCTSPLGTREAGVVTACTDGVDNDNDGAVDLDDPACADPRSTSEISPPSTCSDGEDNDGDGLVDYPEDPDCYGFGGRTEASRPTFSYGPVAIDPQGVFAFVVDRTNSQVIVVDLRSGKLVNVSLDTPWFDSLGVDVGRLSQAITPLRLPFVTVEDREANSNVGLQHRTEAVIANVTSTKGILYFVQAARIEQIVRVTYETADDGTATNIVENEELLSENVISEPQLFDFDLAEPSTDGDLFCDLDDDVVTRISEVRGPTDSDIDCNAPELPKPRALDDEVESRSTYVTFRSTQERRLLLASERIESDPEATDGWLESERPQYNDFAIQSEVWTATYEGVIAQRSDLVVELSAPGVLRSQGGDLCADGIQVGDLVEFTSNVSPIESGQDCTVYEDVSLMWRVLGVESGQLLLSVIPQDEAADVLEDTSSPNLVQALPDRACFAQGLTATVRAHDEWIVVGDRSGFLVDSIGQSGACVSRFNRPDYQGRVRSGERFINPFFSFDLDPGQIEAPRDYSFSFSVNDSYRVSPSGGAVAIGPSSGDVQFVETASGLFVTVTDIGTNIIRILSAGTRRLVSVLL